MCYKQRYSGLAHELLRGAGAVAARLARRDQPGYRNLARLLHPDNHTDEHLKRLAENQMKRVNSIYSTLADPERRREYNRLLRAGIEAVPPRVIVEPPPSARRILARWFAGHAFLLLAIAVAGAALALWLVREQRLGSWRPAAETFPAAETRDTTLREAPPQPELKPHSQRRLRTGQAECRSPGWKISPHSAASSPQRNGRSTS